jgi:hypothetical protein
MINSIDTNISQEGPGEFENVQFKGSFLRTPVLVFFYKKANGNIFAADEQEASTQKYNNRFELIGWSNGENYNNILKNCGIKLNQVIPKNQAEKILRDAFNAELKVAQENLEMAKKEGRSMPKPKRIEWAFDNSVPPQDRQTLSGGKYIQAK